MPGEDAPAAGAATKAPPVARKETREARVSFGMDVAGDADMDSDSSPDVGLVEARRPRLARELEEEDEDMLTPSVESGAAARKRWVWVALGIFLGACAAGFGVVWLLAP